MNKQELADIGIDMTSGLKHFKNNPLMYSRFLDQFLRNDHHLDEAENALNSGNSTLYNEQIASFKKSLDQFGVNRVSEICDNILANDIDETAFAELKSTFNTLIDRYKG